MVREKKTDKFFLWTVWLLTISGTAVFFSASLGVLARSESVFFSVLASQFGLGLGLGLLGMYIASRINYKFWRKYSFYIFLFTLILTAAVFIPSLGWSRLGAERWIKLGPVRFQPAELLKFGFIVYFAAWLSWAKDRAKGFKFGLLPLFLLLGVIAFILLNQPDTKSFILIAVTGMAMLFVSGASIKHILSAGVAGILLLGVLAYSTPYLKERIKTFLDPSRDPRGASYQIQQALIAVGSGGAFGRGYGQSVQKFNYLPEPQGDSVFAVLSEEFGFAGSAGVVALYVLFAMAGLRVAGRAPDLFSGLLVFGIVIIVSAQAFMNIASITGVFPLTGVPLPFMSHGGTSLAVYLAAVGVILQVSKHKKPG